MYDWTWRPYVSVAERRKKALKELEKRSKKGLAAKPIVIDGRKIAHTFWGKAWCDHLESFADFDNRLPRGRTYVRNGSVVHLEIAAGKVTAAVSGSELYEVEIAIGALDSKRWAAVVQACAGQVSSVVALLQGRIAESALKVMAHHEQGLFPRTAELKFSCSCPDWASMCKHVAAVLYGVGARLDHEPELLFTLRRVDKMDLVAAGASQLEGKAARGGKQAIAEEDVAALFGIELDDSTGASAAAATPVIPNSPVTAKPAKQELAKPKLAKPELAKPKLAKPKLAKPKLAKPKLAKPKLAKPKRAKPKPATARTFTKPAPHSRIDAVAGASQDLDDALAAAVRNALAVPSAPTVAARTARRSRKESAR